jgi:hypothetical protein
MEAPNPKSSPGVRLTTLVAALAAVNGDEAYAGIARRALLSANLCVPVFVSLLQ